MSMIPFIFGTRDHNMRQHFSLLKSHTSRTKIELPDRNHSAALCICNMQK